MPAYTYSINRLVSYQYHRGKTVRPICYQTVVCPVLSLCDVRALWPNGWTDQDETWHAGRPRPWSHCVTWGPSSSSPKGAHPQFSAHICCGQTAAWIKMSLGMEIGLGPGDFVLDGDPLPSPKRRALPPSPIFSPCLLLPNGWMDEARTWHGGRPQPRRLCVRCGSSPSPKRGRSPLPNFRPISIVAKLLDASKCHLVWM